jgi:hypothetical protein
MTPRDTNRRVYDAPEAKPVPRHTDAGLSAMGDPGAR